MKAHAEKLMDVSDMQVLDEDDRHDDQSRCKTIKATSTLVKERIGTLVSRLAIKIVLQPLDTDTDAQVAQGDCDFNEKRSRICISSSTREMSQVGCGHPGNFLSM